MNFDWIIGDAFCKSWRFRLSPGASDMFASYVTSGPACWLSTISGRGPVWRIWNCAKSFCVDHVHRFCVCLTASILSLTHLSLCANCLRMLVCLILIFLIGLRSLVWPSQISSRVTSRPDLLPYCFWTLSEQLKEECYQYQCSESLSIDKSRFGQLRLITEYCLVTEFLILFFLHTKNPTNANSLSANHSYRQCS